MMLSSLKSYVPKERWPVFTNPQGSQILALLFQLEKSQYLPPALILERQFLQINEVFKYSIRKVPYYKEILKAAGFRKNEEITPGLWPRVPLLSRSAVQKHQEELLSRKIPLHHGRTQTIRTSGSTGLPVQVTGTDITQFYYRAFALRDHFWQQHDFSCKMAAIRYADKGKAEYPGVSAHDWGVVTDGIIKTGPGVMLNSSTDIAEQAEFLMREEPDYLLSYPSNIEALARHFIREGLKLKKLCSIRTLGEMIGNEVRSFCREAWGVRLVDMYTAQEVGYIALQCPEHEDAYHIQAENLYVEVVDEEGQPCRPGEIGRVLLTTLHNFAMPLIRYEIGDYAAVGGVCSCGRTLPVLSQIMGRKRNMLVLPNGKRNWPDLGMGKTGLNLPIKQFQFVQKSLDEIEARLVTSRQFSGDEEIRFVNNLQNCLRHPFNIEIIYLEDIPRSKGGKFEDFISEIA
jgi:phenylacetate-CoA ligase